MSMCGQRENNIRRVLISMHTNFHIGPLNSIEVDMLQRHLGESYNKIDLIVELNYEF